MWLEVEVCGLLRVSPTCVCLSQVESGEEKEEEDPLRQSRLGGVAKDVRVCRGAKTDVMTRTKLPVAINLSAITATR